MQILWSCWSCNEAHCRLWLTLECCVHWRFSWVWSLRLYWYNSLGTHEWVSVPSRWNKFFPRTFHSITGISFVWRLSAGCLPWNCWHVWQDSTRCPMSRPMPRQNTQVLALSLHFSAPWCPACSFSMLSVCCDCGLCIRYPFSTRSFSMLNSSLYDRYGCRSLDSCLHDSGMIWLCPAVLSILYQRLFLPKSSSAWQGWPVLSRYWCPSRSFDCIWGLASTRDHLRSASPSRSCTSKWSYNLVSVTASAAVWVVSQLGSWVKSFLVACGHFRWWKASRRHTYMEAFTPKHTCQKFPSDITIALFCGCQAFWLECPQSFVLNQGCSNTFLWGINLNYHLGSRIKVCECYSTSSLTYRVLGFLKCSLMTFVPFEVCVCSAELTQLLHQVSQPGDEVWHVGNDSQ